MDQSGRYRATRVLGRGGMAEVLEGVVAGAGGFERRVAIKRILPEHAGDGSFSRMFLDEARIASRLHHANVVAILDFGIADGIPFQVLELVEGVDASSLRKAATAGGQAFPVEIALHVCREIAHALAYAHAAGGDDGQPLGIVHRDVSPHNMLVSWTGDVKLTDFGIAIARDRSEKTETGVAKGKLAYMAPEQAVGGEVDGRADVFSLGCALHALVAGKSPLAGEDRMSSLLTGVPLELDPSVPDDVRPIIERATRRSKVERFPNAGAMADALGEALAKRVEGDSRRFLRQWLVGLRPMFPSPDPAAAPVTLELVREDGTERTFRVHGTAPTTKLPPRSRVRRLAPFVSVALGVLLVGVWSLGGARKSAPLATPTATPTATPLAIVSVADTPPAETPAASPTVSRARPSPPPPSGTGMMAIGGEGAQRAEILVDGVSRGFAPKLLELPAGKHDVVLVRTDGKRIGPKRVEIGRGHTRTAPLRWNVDPP